MPTGEEREMLRQRMEELQREHPGENVIILDIDHESADWLHRNRPEAEVPGEIASIEEADALNDALDLGEEAEPE
jgi:hypothetical protein